MKLIWCVVTAVLVVAHLHSVFSGKISSCPPKCTCGDALCRRRQGRVVCRGITVNCYALGLTEVPDGIPSRVTGIFLAHNSFAYIDLNDFASFNRLQTLLGDNNNVAKLMIDTPVRRLRKLSLKNNQISFLPPRNLMLLRSLVELYLQDNNIRGISEVRFPAKLEQLILNNNNLTELAPGSFRKMKKLRVLKLNNNYIAHIDQNSFRDLQGLEVLELAGNLITEVPNDSFKFLSKGFYLNLKNNRLNEIHPYSFRLFGFKNVHHHQIRLDYNQLQFLSTDLFTDLLSRKSSFSLYFAGNPVFCDCNLLTFRDEAERMIADQNRILCQSPVEYVDISVQDLNIEDCCF